MLKRESPGFSRGECHWRKMSCSVRQCYIDGLLVGGVIEVNGNWRALVVNPFYFGVYDCLGRAVAAVEREAGIHTNRSWQVVW